VTLEDEKEVVYFNHIEAKETYFKIGPIQFGIEVI